MSERARQAVQAFALVMAATAVFVVLAREGQVMLAMLEGIIVPAGVFYEWRWWSSRPHGDPAEAVLRTSVFVTFALAGIIFTQGGSP
jgi:hypothetical protein